MSKREVVALAVGDLHCGSRYGLVSKPQNEGQEWLLANWRQFQRHVTKVLYGKQIVLLLGGDLVDLPGDDDAEADAIALLQPICKISAEIWGAYGTEYHVGADGNDDRGIYRQLGARHSHYARHEIAGRVLDWAHHGANIGRVPWTELNGLRQLAEARYWRCLERGIPPPALILRHHVHVVPSGAPIFWRGIWVTTTPCWKLPDSYLAKRSPGELPTIGGVIWHPGQAPEIIRYTIPDKIAYA